MKYCWYLCSWMLEMEYFVHFHDDFEGRDIKFECLKTLSIEGRTYKSCAWSIYSLVLCPSTALYRHFLKHCTLTNKAKGTI